MSRQYQTGVSEEETTKAKRVLKFVREKGVKWEHMEAMLRSTCIRKIAGGTMRPPRETYERIIGLGVTYGLTTTE